MFIKWKSLLNQKYYIIVIVKENTRMIYMKKFFSFLAVFSILALSSGCSATWEGVKEDSNKAWNSTKGTIHEATE